MSALVGMPIEWLCEVHGAKTKTPQKVVKQSRGEVTQGSIFATSTYN